MSSEKLGTSETHRWRLELSSTLSLHMRHREYVIVISQGCSNSLIQLSEEPLSKNSSRRIDWKSLQWHQSTYCLHSSLKFFFSLWLSKRRIISLQSWHPCSGSICPESHLNSCCPFRNTQYFLFWVYLLCLLSVIFFLINYFSHSSYFPWLSVTIVHLSSVRRWLAAAPGTAVSPQYHTAAAGQL